ncbi:MAG: 5'-nucleotidase C-terminal domain-containing protein [Ignavibacteriaceae bacterium]
MRFLIVITFTIFSVISLNSQTFRLTILHSNDAKSKLIKPTSASQSDFGSVSRMKTLYDSLESRAIRNGYNVLKLSSGNNILASPEFYISQQLPADQFYYDSRGMNQINFDAMGFGNHEFDFGPDVTAKYVNGFQSEATHFIASNINFSQEDSLNDLFIAGKIKRYKVVTAGGENIGIIAIISPELKTLSSPRNITVDTAITEIINKYVDTLTNLGVNKIILLSNYQGIRQDSLIIRNTRGIDIVLSAHDYEILANPNTVMVPGDSSFIYGAYPYTLLNADNQPVYLVKTGAEYKYVGKLDLEFNAAGGVTSIGNESNLMRVASETYSDGVVTNQYIETHIIIPLQSGLNALAGNIIGISEVNLDGLMGSIRTKETNLGNLCADAMLWQAKELATSFGVPMPDIALHNGGGIRNNNVLPAGNISELTTFAIMPFGNFNSIVRDIPPQQLKEILENGVSRVETVEGRFTHVAGLKFIYNPNAQAQVLDNSGNAIVPGKRIWEVRLNNGTYIMQNGVVNSSAPPVSIAIINFLAKGGDQYPFRGAPFTTLGVTDQQSLAKYIQEGLSGLITGAMYPFGGEGRIIADPTANYQDENSAINDFNLLQNFPNPFNSSTLIKWTISERSHVSLTIYDILGNKINCLINEIKDQGSYSVIFNTAGLSSGVYFYKLKAGGFVMSKKMIYLK